MHTHIHIYICLDICHERCLRGSSHASRCEKSLARTLAWFTGRPAVPSDQWSLEARGGRYLDGKDWLPEIWAANIFFPLFNVSFALLQSSPFALCLPNRLPTWPQTHESAGIALGPGLKWHVRDWQYVFLCSITSRLRSLKWFTVYIHILIAYHYHYDDDDYY